MDLPEGITGKDTEAPVRLAAHALSAWDIEVVAITPIKIRENAIFRVDRLNGGPVLLRVHRRGYHSDQALLSEFHWLQALAAAGLDVPRPLSSLSGDYIEILRFADDSDTMQVDVLEWMDGEQFGSSEFGVSDSQIDIATKYRGLGDVVALLHTHASTWALPAGFCRHAWDIDGLIGEQSIWGRFWDLPWLSPAQRRLVVQTRRALRLGLVVYGTRRGDYSLIHADLNPENILIHHDRMRIIDFDDAGFGWHLFDLATILYFARGHSYFDVACASLLEGYRSRRSLTDEQWSHLPLFTAARATTYLGWVNTRRDSEHVRRQSQQLIDAACEAANEYLKTRDSR
jgi:Ser/Thr protein kinase RdoA (MazF antagonist)